MMTTSQADTYQTLQIRREGALLWLTLHRPEKFNTMSRQMIAELQALFDALRDDRGIRVVILRGAGKHFCAGLDIDEVEQITSTPDSIVRVQQDYSRMIVTMRRCPQPVIALLHGAASGGGLAIALAADVRYAAEGARMNVAMAKVGLSGTDMGISYFLPRAVGTSNAAELMMGGRFADAQKALRIGLVSEVVPLDQLEATGRALAEDMLAMSPLGLRMTKENLNAAQDAGSLEAVIALEDRTQMLCVGRHFREGAAAFKQKRRANYDDL